MANDYSISVTVSESIGELSWSVSATIENMKGVHHVAEAIQAADSLMGKVIPRVIGPDETDEEHS